MTAQARPRVTEAEYLALERASTTRHEYYNARVYAMTGGTESHNLIAANALSAIHVQLRRRPCRVYGSDMRIKVLATALHTYPDVTIVCGPADFIDSTRDTITNPVAIMEVLSPSTERYDRGLKFQNYRMIETLRDYLLIAQDQPLIEHYQRQETGEWLLREAAGLDAMLTIESIGCGLALRDVYEKVDFDAADQRIAQD